MPLLNTNRRIFFLSHSIYPKPNSGGGSVLLYRHLSRLQKAGFEIVLLHAIQNPPSQTEFGEINIEKKFWYPPLRPKTPTLTELRVQFYYIAIKDKIKFKSSDIILSYFGDYTNLLALKISQNNKLPLYMIYHDDSLFNEYFKENLLSKRQANTLLSKTSHFFAVSEQMRDLLIEKGAASCSVLYPIPEVNAGKTKSVDDVNFDCLNICFAGSIIEKMHSDILLKIAAAIQLSHGQLTLFSNKLSDSLTNKLTDQCLTHLKGWKSTSEIFDFFNKKADVLLVYYSFKPELELRMFHSFPSKFTEYCSLGIPVLLIAPNFSSLGKWAIENKWLTYIDNDSELEISKMLNQLKKKSFWLECQQQSLSMSQTQFNPDTIHTAFQDTLLRK